MRVLGRGDRELDQQHRQAQPRLDEAGADGSAGGEAETRTVDGLLNRMQELVAGMRATRSEVEELQEQVEALQVLVTGLAERS